MSGIIFAAALNVVFIPLVMSRVKDFGNVSGTGALCRVVKARFPSIAGLRLRVEGDNKMFVCVSYETVRKPCVDLESSISPCCVW